MDDWGFQGPTLEGVEAVHVTYLSVLTVIFKDAESAKKAVEQTGWERWGGDDDPVLEMKFHEDLLETKDGFFELQMDDLGNEEVSDANPF